MFANRKDNIGASILAAIVFAFFFAVFAGLVAPKNANAGDYRHGGYYGHNGRTVIVKQRGISDAGAAAIGLGSFAVGMILGSQQQHQHQEQPQPRIIYEQQMPVQQPSVTVNIFNGSSAPVNVNRCSQLKGAAWQACFNTLMNQAAAAPAQNYEEQKSAWVKAEQRQREEAEQGLLCAKYGEGYCLPR
ncbi:MAG: hypothetical protein Q8R36_01045 [bacterium]|nr:hypothetical protein [bacterium]